LSGRECGVHIFDKIHNAEDVLQLSSK